LEVKLSFDINFLLTYKKVFFLSLSIYHLLLISNFMFITRYIECQYLRLIVDKNARHFDHLF